MLGRRKRTKPSNQILTFVSDWYTDPFNRFLTFIQEADRVLNLSIKGIFQISHQMPLLEGRLMAAANKYVAVVIEGATAVESAKKNLE